MTNEELDNLYKEYDQEFEIYKSFLNDEYQKTNVNDYKNMLMTSVLNRSLALIEAYKVLLPSNNLMVLNSLSRLQIDNCIFIYGVKMLIDNGHSIYEVGSAIMNNNKKLSDYKIGKNKLCDTYIISELNNKYHLNIKNIYKFYCRFVHFSDSALLSSSQVSEENIFSIELSKDYSRFEKYIFKNAKLFSELNKLVLILLNNEWKEISNSSKII